MKLSLFAILLFLDATQSIAQDEVIALRPDMFVGDDIILLGTYDGWLFKSGPDSLGLHSADESPEWMKLKPEDLTPSIADENGRIEGWFTIKVRRDPSFGTTPLALGFGAWPAVDVYLDNELLGHLGNTGEPFEEVNPYRRDILPLDLTPQKIHRITFHVVDYVSTYPFRSIRGGPYALKYYVHVSGPRYKDRISAGRLWDYLEAFWASVNGTTFVILLVVSLFNRNERNLPLIVANTGVFFLAALLNIPRFHSELSFRQHNILEFFVLLVYPFNIILGTLLIARIFRFKLTRFINALLIVVFVIALVNVVLRNDSIQTALALITVFLGFYMLIRSWSTLRGAQWAIVVGLLISTFTFISYGFIISRGSASLAQEIWLITVVFIATPLSLAFYVAIRFTEIVNELRRHASDVIKVSEEKESILASQNETLEQQVKDRTTELTKSIERLTSTQAQLVQSEKMASLGELTSGIAHEIQNPLNFINNFSELNNELVDELKKELSSGNLQTMKDIADTIKENQQKINHHGKRADGIVKSMLQHSRASSGQREWTDLNSLCDEYIRLAYHGYRAKDKTFNTKIETDFDPAIRKVNVVPQEIGRVILNLVNNAFYAVNEKSKKTSSDYKPLVKVKTENLNDKIEIIIADNGDGIPESIKEKIFQPFFTTKPTGQGTGLGLSLSYDIIKALGGKIEAISKQGSGTEFIVHLPINP